MEPFEKQPVSWVRHLAQFLVIALLVLLFTALLGTLIFALHRVALADRRLYSALFAAAFAGFLTYLAGRAVKRRTFARAARKILRFLFALLMGAAVAGALMAYGGFVVRRPFLGAACFPPIAAALYLAGKKGGLFARLKNLYRKLN